MTAQIEKESRIGKQPVPVPQGVKVTIEGQRVEVQGPKGRLARTFRPEVRIEREGEHLRVRPAPGSGRLGRQFQGLTRALLRNMVEGCSKGYQRSLDLRGVGYRADIKGQTLTMLLGYSHPVVMQIPEGIKVRSEIVDTGGLKYPRVHLESHDKELLGQVAARIRSKRPPEPYKGKGVRYTGERIVEKAGKAAKAGK